jgi:hypothetical protein
MPIKFQISDRANKALKDKLLKKLNNLEFKQTANSSEVDFLVVHRNTDAPRRKFGISQDTVDNVLERGGIFVEYTGGGAHWKIEAQRHMFGSFAELLNRLERLQASPSIDDLRKVLEGSLPSMELTSALLVLCQGYLAVHELSGKSSNIIKLPQVATELLSKDLQKKVRQVESPGWWIEDTFDVIDPITGKISADKWNRFITDICEELGVEKSENLPGSLRQLFARLNALKELNEPEVIALAYSDLAARKGSNPISTKGEKE